MSTVGGWKEGINELPRFVPTFDLDPRKTALIIVDMQYLDAHPDYGLGAFLKKKYPAVHSYYSERLAQVVIPNHRKLLDFFRKNGLRVIYLRIGPLLRDRSDLTPLRKQRESGDAQGRPAYLSPVGTFEHQIVEEISPREGELIIDKNSSGAFNSTAIDQILRNMQVDCLVITGVVTWACVLVTALDAADRGYKCVVVEDAVAGLDEELHSAALRIFYAAYGRVETADTVCVELERCLSTVV